MRIARDFVDPYRILLATTPPEPEAQRRTPNSYGLTQPRNSQSAQVNLGVGVNSKLYYAAKH